MDIRIYAFDEHSEEIIEEIISKIRTRCSSIDNISEKKKILISIKEKFEREMSKIQQDISQEEVLRDEAESNIQRGFSEYWTSVKSKFGSGRDAQKKLDEAVKIFKESNGSRTS